MKKKIPKPGTPYFIACELRDHLRVKFHNKEIEVIPYSEYLTDISKYEEGIVALVGITGEQLKPIPLPTEVNADTEGKYLAVIVPHEVADKPLRRELRRYRIDINKYNLIEK
ncbi:hypothetical protein EZS27_012231 [termite gut metagenome]|uniref:Uncharacterized protein n=1 Tax=termite gut metagenome TaxID=433724 RepID=A0A5J4S198_9ZZZZ